MKYAVALLAIGLGLTGSARSADVPDEHERILNQLDGMLERVQAEKEYQARKPLPVTPPSQPVVPDQAIAQFAGRYWNGREDLVRGALDRMAVLRPSLERLLAGQGLPPELSALVLVESAAQPFALSPKQARGLWQFIPATATRYGLVISAGVDHRVELEHSTLAAARYLRDLYSQFRDWRLALAAYNAGEGAVSRAIGKARTADFDALVAKRLLPAETRQYVPAVLDAIELLGGSKLALLAPGSSGEGASLETQQFTSASAQ